MVLNCVSFSFSAIWSVTGKLLSRPLSIIRSPLPLSVLMSGLISGFSLPFIVRLVFTLPDVMYFADGIIFSTVSKVFTVFGISTPSTLYSKAMSGFFLSFLVLYEPVIFIEPSSVLPPK